MHCGLQILGVAAALALFQGLAMSARGPTLTVSIVNQVAVPAGILDRAIATAGRIFQEAGIETEWRMQGDGNGRTADLIVVVANGPSRFPVETDALGTIFWTQGAEPPTSADIFFRPIAEQATSKTEAAFLLANVMVHELGHLLLGPKHSLRGVMCGQWGRTTLRSALRMPLRFEKQEAIGLQQAALRFSESPARNQLGSLRY